MRAVLSHGIIMQAMSERKGGSPHVERDTHVVCPCHVSELLPSASFRQYPPGRPVTSHPCACSLADLQQT